MRVNETPTAFEKAVASEVRAEMARQQVTQKALGEKLGWPQQKLSRRVSGAVPFDVAELDAIAVALGISVMKLLPETEAAR